MAAFPSLLSDLILNKVTLSRTNSGHQPPAAARVLDFHHVWLKPPN